jgi:hypothetical protein
MGEERSAGAGGSAEDCWSEELVDRPGCVLSVKSVRASYPTSSARAFQGCNNICRARVMS